MALILYAAPTVIDINDLVNQKKRNKVIENSNFKKSSDLSGHERNTYIEAGTYSIACSEPKEIENINLLKFLEISDVSHNLNNNQFIIETRNRIETHMLENETYNESFIFLREKYNSLSEYKKLYSFIIMKIFRDLTGVQWLIGI